MNKKNESVGVSTNEAKVSTAEVADKKTNRKAELQKAVEEIQKQYQGLSSKIQESDNLIAELADRQLRQREAKNIYQASMTKLEREYADIVNELKSIGE